MNNAANLVEFIPLLAKIVLIIFILSIFGLWARGPRIAVIFTRIYSCCIIILAGLLVYQMYKHLQWK